MAEDIHRARLTALSLAHGTALAQLLRSHGHGEHADRLESALQEIFRIIATEIGGGTLGEAMRWLAEQNDDEGGATALSLRH